jgi:predicted DNA binding CopG/RHH family protein
MTRRIKLEAGERGILDSYERGEWQSIGVSPSKLEQYQSYAIAALEAEGLISIVLPREDLKAVRRKAAEAGISYQMFVANIVHQFVTGHLVQRPRV